jgi:lipoprotein-anchoring transpeptidase ErfK/SrfK
MTEETMADTHPKPLWRRFARTATVAVLASVLLTTACTGGNGGSSEPDGPLVTATILEPADDTIGVLTSTAIVFTTENAADATVELADLAGNSIEGEMSPDGTQWQPTGQLAWENTYVATLTAVSAEGEPVIATSTFTTMAEPANTVRVFSFLASENVIGVGMPLRVEFKDDADNPQEIPEEFRAEVERRMQVRTEPAQEGTWHWRSGWEVHYRPAEFWQPGTQINYRVATGGLPVGEDRYLRNDLNVSLSVGRDIRMSVDAQTRQMTVREDGEVVRTIPVSLGRRDFPSSSGTFVIMEKYLETVFDTFAELGPDDGYRVDIEYAMRYTTRGEFMHADVRDGSALGSENVTHGCINMSRDNAEWLFDLTHRWGDPVTIEGTTRRFEPGNGWTDWNLTFEDYQRRSALHDG